MQLFKTILKWVGFVDLFLVLFAFTLMANKKRQNTVVENLTVQFENQLLEFVNENDLARMFPPVDSQFYGITKDIDLIEIESKINKNDYVENSNAFINNRGELAIRIRQKEPLFRVFHQNGVNYYVDRMGIKFPNSSTFTANVPIATGRIIYNIDSLGVQKGASINNLVKFFDFINEDESLKALVSQVDVKANGDLVFTPRMGNHLVNIGQPVELEDKMERLKIFYKQGLNKIGWDEYGEISLKYKNQIIAKKK